MIDRLDGLAVGDRADFVLALDDSKIAAFAALTAMPADAGLFLQTLGGTLISSLLGMSLPGEGCLWVEQDSRWVGPAPRPGETLRAIGELRQVSRAQRALTIAVTLEGDGARPILAGTARVKLLSSDENRGNMDDPHELGAIIVSGASRGIGAAIATMLAEQGFAVVINAVHRLDLAEAVADGIRRRGGRALAVQADISDIGAVRDMAGRAIDTFGRLWGAVANAAPALELRPAVDTAWDDFARHLDVQVRGTYALLSACLPQWHLHKAGAFVALGSAAAHGRPPEGFAAYVTAKAALAAMVRAYATELGPKGVRVNMVSPGMTRTDMIAGMPEKAQMLTRAQTPLRRLADASDIAEAVSFLMGPRAAHITGQDLPVCGGMTMP
ncbi:MAG: SDR family oxidoreductase [Alphaproteobacteria bacterium]|nr:SDR family oxidoreductase [Alphaproteobacteria bacterium]